MIYRRRTRSDVWHWIEACSNWPNDMKVANGMAVEIERGKRPTTGEACDQCIAKERRANFEVEP